MRFLYIGFLCLCVPLTAAQTQSNALRLGALLPLSGAEQEMGTVLRKALEAARDTVEDRGLELELVIADSRSDRAQSVLEARTLIGEGIHALICCETPEAAAPLIPLAEAGNVPLLGLSGPESSPGSYWFFNLGAGEGEQLERLSLETSIQPFGLMLPKSQAGTLAAQILRTASAGIARYSSPTPTPEALWVATREPASVVVWDNADGTLAAADALVARGYRGPLVIRAELLDTLSALGRARLSGAKSPLSPAVLGYTLSDAHPSKETVSRFRRALISVPEGLLDNAALTRGATAWDAVQLLGAAGEQMLAYSLELTDPRAARQDLRDTLIGLGPLVGAGGSYDFSEGDASGLEPDSLVIGTWQRGRFRP